MRTLKKKLSLKGRGFKLNSVRILKSQLPVGVFLSYNTSLKM
jgi:hypothetical protein